MNEDLKHKTQRVDSDVRIIPYIDQTDMFVVLVSGMTAFMIAGRLISNFGLRIVLVAAVVFIAYRLCAVAKRYLAPYPKALPQALSWTFTPDVLDVQSDPNPVPLYHGQPPIPE